MPEAAIESFSLTIGCQFSHQHLALLSHLIEIWNLAWTPGLPHQNLYLNSVTLAFERTWDVDSLLYGKSLWFIFGHTQLIYGFFLYLGLVGVVSELVPYLANLTTVPSLSFL